MARSDVATSRGRETSLPATAIERTLDLLITERQRLRQLVSVDPQLLEANRQALILLAARA